MYRAGQLNQRIQLERDVTTTDDGGGKTTEPQVYASLWCYVREKSSRELIEAQGVASTASKIFVIRFRAGILASDRIIWRGDRYNIRTQPDPNAREAFLELEAEIGVAQ